LQHNIDYHSTKAICEAYLFYGSTDIQISVNNCALIKHWSCPCHFKRNVVNWI